MPRGTHAYIHRLFGAPGNVNILAKPTMNGLDGRVSKGCPGVMIAVEDVAEGWLGAKGPPLRPTLFRINLAYTSCFG